MATRDQRQLIETIVANGKVESNELEALRNTFLSDGKIDRNGADLLVELFKRIQRRNPGFEEFFYQTIKNHILTDGKINAEEASWLRQMLLADDIIDDRERKFLHELKGEAKEISPEFHALFEECMKFGPQSKTAGGGR